MSEERHDMIPDNADDLSIHAPTLHAMKGKVNGFVVSENYFNELPEKIISRVALPDAGEFPVSESYFAESEQQINAGTVIPTENGFNVPESYFENFEANLEARLQLENHLPKTESEIPEGYFGELERELKAHISLDNLKQDEGFVIPEKYFGNLTDRILSQTSLSDEELHGDEVPAGYFDSLADRVIAKVEPETKSETKQVRVIVFAEYIQRYGKITAVAASVALLIVSIWFITNNNDVTPMNDFASNETRVEEDTVTVHAFQPQQRIAKRAEQQLQNIAKNSDRVKPLQTENIKLSKEAILAESDMMDEALVAEFITEDGISEENSGDEEMMQYLLDDGSSLDIIDPGNRN
jgi:hypothetical protein